MDFDGLDRQLRDSLADLKLSNEERDELRQLGSELAPDQVRFLRNRAFDLVRELVLLEEQGERIAALKWLEQVVRTLEVTAAPPRSRASAYFSPGEECRRKIRELCRQARQSLDICVFTISDDQLSAEILACHRRGVPVRIISDDDKQFDEGSDIHALREAGVPLRIDDSPFHMHHKFALVDGSLAAQRQFQLDPQRQRQQRREPAGNRRRRADRRLSARVRGTLGPLRPALSGSDARKAGQAVGRRTARGRVSG